MSLTLPVVGSTIGPEWAEQLNTALETIDVHDHSSGNGVQIPSAGININTDLSFNGYSPTALESAVFGEVAGTPANRSIYVSSGELYYKDGSGTSVKITESGAIAGTPGTIANLGAGGSSAVFSDLAEDFSWFFDGSKVAAQNMGDIRLYPFDGSTQYNNFITLKSPTTLASNYSLTFPTTLPGAGSIVQVSAAGSLSYSNTLSQGLLTPNGSVSAPAYSFSGDTDCGLYLDTTNQIAFAAGGTRRLLINVNSVETSVPVLVPAGSSGTPSLAFATDTDTGLYLEASNTINITAGGIPRLSISSTISTNNTSFDTGAGAITGASLNVSSGTITGGSLNVGSGAITGGAISGSSLNVSTGAIIAGSIDLSSGGALKMKIFTGSLATTTAAILTVPGSSIIYGACGTATFNASTSNWQTIGADSFADVVWNNTGNGTTTVGIYNKSATQTNQYRVVVFYI